MRLLAALLFVGVLSACASAQSASEQKIDDAPAANFTRDIPLSSSSIEFNLRMKQISNAFAELSQGQDHIGAIYLTMHDACETALNNNVSPVYSRPAEAWKGAYCSCDAFITIEGWLENPDMVSLLELYRDSPNPTFQGMILSNHGIFAQDTYCRHGVERDVIING